MRSILKTFAINYLPPIVVNWLRAILTSKGEKPEGSEGIDKLGHRLYVGGHWEEMGDLQFGFLVSKGLTPKSSLFDVACGSLRLGRKAIPFLESGHYFGLEKESELVTAGLESEIEKSTVTEKSPTFVISNSFEFEKFNHEANFAIANSLFSHLTPELIKMCLSKLHPFLKDNGVFYATFYESKGKTVNPTKSHDHGYFAYTKSEIISFGESTGYNTIYIGDWGHPSHQIMIEFRKRG